MFSSSVSITVRKTYVPHSSRAVSLMRGDSFSYVTPVTSAAYNCIPPKPNSGRIATLSTMIPIPPSHWQIARHSRMECVITSTFGITVAPMVENPAMVSNQLSVIVSNAPDR